MRTRKTVLTVDDDTSSDSSSNISVTSNKLTRRVTQDVTSSSKATNNAHLVATPLVVATTRMSLLSGNPQMQLFEP